MQIRPYQEDLLNAMLQAKESGARSILFRERPGFGRSRTLSGLVARSCGKKLAVLEAPMVDQLAEAASSLELEIEVTSYRRMLQDSGRDLSGLGVVILGECCPGHDKARLEAGRRIREASPDCLIVEEGQWPSSRNIGQYDLVIERTGNGEIEIIEKGTSKHRSPPANA